MNAMVQDMSWDLAARQEGSEITALSSNEVSAVSGGDDWPTYVRAVATVIGLAAAAYSTWKKRS